MAAITTHQSQSIADFYAGCSVFLTGGSGFIGKQLVEKLLRSCPKIGRIFVLIRSRKNQTSVARMQHILSSPLFAEVKRDHPDIESKIVVVDGDLEHPELDIEESVKERIFEEVSVVFHLAATVSFNEPLRVAVGVNIIGLRNVLNFSKQIKKLEAFVHTSTAYANCNRDEIAESVYSPPLKPKQILDAMEWMNDDMLKDITSRIIGSWPNTYTFTKAIAEDLLLQERQHMPTAIFRPSIVTSTIKEPISGWVDNYNGVTGALAAVGSGLIKAFYGAYDTRLDLVPVDMTANALVAIGWYTASTKDRDQVLVYNYTSGTLNPLTWRNMEPWLTNAFRKYPFENAVWIPKVYITENSFWSKCSLHGDIYMKLVAIDWCLRLIGKKPKLVRIHRFVCGMVMRFEYFTCREWTWAVDNICNLRENMLSSDRQVFDFDVRQIDWKSYFENYISGIRQYVLNQDVKTLPSCRRTLQRLFWLRRGFVVALFVFCFRLAVSRNKTARWLWRFTVSVITAMLQKMPRIAHA